MIMPGVRRQTAETGNNDRNTGPWPLADPPMAARRNGEQGGNQGVFQQPVRERARILRHRRS